MLLIDLVQPDLFIRVNNYNVRCTAWPNEVPQAMSEQAIRNYLRCLGGVFTVVFLERL